MYKDIGKERANKGLIPIVGGRLSVEQCEKIIAQADKARLDANKLTEPPLSKHK